ncbi:hypothetical protein ACHAWC_002487 [Mediolabrus comicus]
MEPKNIAIGGEGEEATRIQTYVEMKANNAAKTSAAAVGNHPQLIRKKQPAGPQLWAVVFTIGGLYYVWTRVLGRSIRFALPQRSGHRIKGHGGATTTTDMQAARERRLAALENANRAREVMVNQAAKNNDGNIRERTNVNSVNSNINHNSSSITLEERQRQNQLNMQKRQKQQELEDKKKKQRQLYLRQKALKEKEEEERRKDEELGPGWRAREDPTVVTNLLEQQGNNGGSYKAQTCTRRGG